VRKRRRTMPLGTRWVSYAPGAPVHTAVPRRTDQLTSVTAIRFAVMGRVPMKATNGVLLADRAHGVAGTRLDRAGIPDARRREILGTGGAGTDHAHAHWITLPDSGERGRAFGI
jgi:CRISPR-associated protein Csb2